jgi:GT2 family glycosyltransferase
MELSIIVLTCNQKGYTLGLLRSISAFMQQHDAEMVLIDNASTDGTIDSIGEATATWASKLRIIRNSENCGVAAARNQGLQIANGDKILILDNDTIVTTEAIEAMMHYLDANPTCGLVAPALYFPSGERQLSAKPFPGIADKLRHLRHAAPSAEEMEVNNSLHPFYVMGACQMFRKTLLGTIGYLDDKIFYGPEDADFCMRIRQAGYTVDLQTSISIIHDAQRATRRSPFSRLSLLHIKALIYFYIKHRRCI